MAEVSPLHVPSNGVVTVQWEGALHPTDWVGLHKVGANNDAFLDWKYLSTATKSSGPLEKSWSSCQFTMPAVAGQYEFRFFRNDGFDRFDLSEVVRVV
jgi:hypothetical protein